MTPIALPLGLHSMVLGQRIPVLQPVQQLQQDNHIVVHDT